MPKIDSVWLQWINENLLRSCNKKDLFEILLKNDFEFEDIITHLSKSYKCDYCSINNILKNHTNSEKIQTYKLDIYKVDNFLNEYECDELLLNLLNESFFKSTITTDITEIDKNFRTSTTCYLNNFNTVYNNLDNKICEFIGIEKERSEHVQGQKYKVGQEFKLHTDYFSETPDNNKFLSNGGQRTWTFMIYLNNVEEGGSTNFPLIDIDILPKKGSALIWYNLDSNQNCNEYSKHSGTPIIKGEKYILTKWFRKGKTNYY